MNNPEEVESKLPSVFKLSFLFALVCFFTLFVSLVNFLGGDLSLFNILVFLSSLSSPNMLFFSFPIFWFRFEKTLLITGPVSVNPLDLLLGDLIFDVFLRQIVVDLWLGLGLKGLILGLTLRKGSLNCSLFFLISSLNPFSLVSVITLLFRYSF